MTYVGLSADPQSERIAFNAVLDVQKDGEQFTALTPARNYYPTQDPAAGPIGRYFDGEATSEIGLKSGPVEDFWVAFQPDLTTISDDIERGNRQLADLPPSAQGLAIVALAQTYADDPPPATFRVIVNPMVIWLWIGALIALGGAAFAIWPSSEARRRVQAAYEARVGRESTHPPSLSAAWSSCSHSRSSPRSRSSSSGPSARRRRATGVSDPVEDEVAELEARKETLYREIRDAEADRASGKLADDDFARLDARAAPRGDRHPQAPRQAAEARQPAYEP